MYLEYGTAIGICSAFRKMATLRGYAVRTHAALPIALPSIIHLAGRFQLGGGPHSCLDGDGRLHDRAFLDVAVLPNCVEVSGNAGGHLAAAVGQGASLTVLRNLCAPLSRPPYGARSACDWEKPGRDIQPRIKYH